MPTAPYDSLNAVLNTARTRLNDAVKTLQPVTGQILMETQPFTLQVTNAAYRRLQEFLAHFGYEKLTKQTAFLTIPAVANQDPVYQAMLDWTGYSDGTSPLVPSIALPQDLIQPEELWERQSGQVPAGNFLTMDRDLQGLPLVTKDFLNHRWEWRSDQIVMPGATGNTDLMVRYMAYLADFADNTPLANTPWYNQPVPIMRSLNALAFYICFEFAKGRADMDAGAFQVLAEDAASKIVDRDLAQPRALQKVSEAGKMKDRFTPEPTPAPGNARE